MGFRYTDDPLRDYEAYEAELVRLEEQVPVCDYCNRPVMDDFYYEINEEPVCADCLEQYFKREVVVE